MAEGENDGKNDGKKNYTGLMNSETGKKFSADNQPSSEAKSEGLRRYWATRNMVNAVAGKFSDDDTDYAGLTARYYGVPVEQVTVKMIMDFRQMEKAIKEGDTRAYKAVNDRAFGRPAEEQPAIIDQPKDEKNKIVLPGGIPLEF